MVRPNTASDVLMAGGAVSTVTVSDEAPTESVISSANLSSTLMVMFCCTNCLKLAAVAATL